MNKFLIFLSLVFILTGCATTAEKQKTANDYYTAQKDFAASQAAGKKPIFEMKGIEGQSIELKGVQSLTVWGGGEGQQATLQAAPVQRSEFVEGLGMVKDTILGIMPYALGAKVITGIAKISADGRGATTTTTTTNANQSNQANQANQANTSNANQSTTNTTGSNSVIGSGSSSTPTTTTSTTTDNHAVSTTTDNHTVTSPAQIPAGKICTATAAGVITCL